MFDDCMVRIKGFMSDPQRSQSRLRKADGHTLSGNVLGPRSLKGSLKRLLSLLLRASLMVIGVSGDGAGFMVDILMVVIPACLRLTLSSRAGERALEDGCLKVR